MLQTPPARKSKKVSINTEENLKKKPSTLTKSTRVRKYKGFNYIWALTATEKKSRVIVVSSFLTVLRVFF